MDGERLHRKKTKEEALLDKMAKDYPRALHIADIFYWKNIHVFDSHSHRLARHVEDRSEARIALRMVELIGKIHGREKRLNKDEKKCLDSTGPDLSNKK